MVKSAYVIGLLGAAVGVLALSFSAPVQAASVYTGGEKGAYHSLFCPPVPKALESEYFFDYVCTPSAGTVDNINKVLANPRDIGFAQLDVFAREAQRNPDVAANLTIVRTLACEGLWAVTKNDRVNSFGDILGLSRRMPFVLGPEGSGSTATFEYLQTLDPTLGAARNVDHVASTTDIINTVANSTRGEVGFFVQFADPTNANIQAIVENELKVIPVVTRELVDAKMADGTKLYQIQSFEMESGGIFSSATEFTTACTPVVIFTGNPDSPLFINPDDAADQRDMLEAIKSAPDDAFLPEVPLLAKLISGAKSLSKDAVEELIAGVENAKELIEQEL